MINDLYITDNNKLCAMACESDLVGRAKKGSGVWRFIGGVKSPRLANIIAISAKGLMAAVVAGTRKLKESWRGRNQLSRRPQTHNSESAPLSYICEPERMSVCVNYQSCGHCSRGRPDLFLHK